MNKPTKQMRQKILVTSTGIIGIIIVLICRLFYMQIINYDYLQEKAYEQQTRDRLIKADRGTIYDRNMVPIATTKTVSSISVIRAQIKDPEGVAKILSEKLDLEYEYVLKKVNNKVALERIKTKVDKEIADEIRKLELDGVMIDEDIKRVYPFSNMASQVIGFVGKDNQGIIGLESKYDEYLMGESGKILTETDAKGKKMPNGTEVVLDAQKGENLVTSIDLNLQLYAEQTLDKVMESTQAKRSAIILMNPKTGEILTMANKPNFDLNSPFEINDAELKLAWEEFDSSEQNDMLNKMWRNFSINDTYEPGSVFKIFTASAGLEADAITESTSFVCTGAEIVAGVRIKCWRSHNPHGVQHLAEGLINSCNPVFMQIAAKLQPDEFYKYLDAFGFNEKTKIDLPGEAGGILHKLENVGPIELATMSFGQSFQITPIQLLSAASSVINGGKKIVPHVGVKIIDNDGNIKEEFYKDPTVQVISEETSGYMRYALEDVVYEGTGAKTYIPGYRIGGKTATSEKLPRGSGKYIASFMAFAPAEDPEVIALVLIDEPVGAYYGGQIAGPVMKDILENALPYLGIEPVYNEEEVKLETTQTVTLPDFTLMELSEAKKEIKNLGLEIVLVGSEDGEKIIKQFPMAEEVVNKNTKIVIYVE